MKTNFYLVFSIFSLMFMTSCLCSDPPARRSSGGVSNDEDIQKFTAYNVAENYVTQRLKSPSTAEFPPSHEKSDHVTKSGSDVFIIDSWVDSQNSFGAKIRTYFHMKVTITGETARVSDFSTRN